MFPILKPAELDIEIMIRFQKRYLKLQRESYLGYDQMPGGQAKYRQVRIFKGRLIT